MQREREFADRSDREPACEQPSHCLTTKSALGRALEHQTNLLESLQSLEERALDRVLALSIRTLRVSQELSAHIKEREYLSTA